MKQTQELRDLAEQLLSATTMAGKLNPPHGALTDEVRGGGLAPDRPCRPDGLEIQCDTRFKRKVPPPEGWPDPVQRVRILHGLANHELQAIELFAWAILRYPEAPPSFRRGLLRILVEEQQHCRMYIERLESLGARFGDEPVSGYFWGKVAELESPAQFVSTMCLTFENANLDHALDLRAAALAVHDQETAAILKRVHDDEVGHVKFGWKWLNAFKDPSVSMTDAYLNHVVWPLRPVLARGRNFNRDSRVAAGLDEDFIQLLDDSVRPKDLYRFEKFGGSAKTPSPEGEVSG